MSAEETAKDFYSKLQDLVEAVRIRDREDVDATCWKTANDELRIGLEVWRAAIGSISATATKLGMILAEPSLCSEAISQCEQLATACYVISKSGAGTVLNDLIYTSTLQVLRAMANLAESLIASKPTEIPPKAGIVWEACDAALKSPKSNRAAFHRKIMAACCELKDSFQEFRSLLHESNSEEDREVAEDDDDALFLEREEYTRLETQAVHKVLLALQGVGKVLQSVLLRLDDLGNKGEFSGISRLYASANQTHLTVTSLAEELYPPLDTSALSTALASLLADISQLDLRENEMNLLDISRDRISTALQDELFVTSS